MPNPYRQEGQDRWYHIFAVPFVALWFLVYALVRGLIGLCRSSESTCEGCHRGYPKNETGQHVWPSGIGGGDYRPCAAATAESGGA